MKKLLFLLLIVSTVVFATQTSTLKELSNVAVSNWQALAFLSLIISAILVGMGYAVGIGFEMPRMKAWAGNELSQIFANAILIIAIIGTIGFLDTLMIAMVNESGVGGLNCNIGDNCLKKTANAYLNDYIDMAKSGAKSVLIDSMKHTSWAGNRVGIHCTTIYCGMVGANFALVPHYALDADRLTVVFEYYTGVLASMEGQKFFVNEIGFKGGPLLLAIGIVMRGFFFTRKTGGLLIAIAAGVMFFYPAMYVFDWMTLDLAITGDKGVGDIDQSCPKECRKSPPMAFYQDGKKTVTLSKTSQIYARFPTDTAGQEKARSIALGKTGSGSSKTPVKYQTDKQGKLVYSCQYVDPSVKGNDNKPLACPKSCLELPYPYESPTCANHTIEAACNVVPGGCKVIRIKELSANEKVDYNKCPAECKIIPPLASKCPNSCLGSRYDCRVTKRQDTTWRPSLHSKVDSDTTEGKAAIAYCDRAKNCPSGGYKSQASGSGLWGSIGGIGTGSGGGDGISGSAPGGSSLFGKITKLGKTGDAKSCVWIFPQYGSCTELCSGCPGECRIIDANKKPATGLPSKCNSLAACKTCPTTCKIPLSTITAAAKGAKKGECSSCPTVKRIYGAPTLPEDYVSGKCDLKTCPVDYRAKIPSSACETCMFTEESYMYDPPISRDCSGICKPKNKIPSKASGDYAKIGADGFVGREEIKGVSQLMIPAYLLPIFNITATLIFIKAFSRMIGGDIEIPGMSKVF